MTGSSTGRIVVVGGGHAATQIIDSLRREGHSGELVLVSDEQHMPYQRPPLSKKYLAGDVTLERIALRPPALFEKLAVDTRLGCRAVAIHRDRHHVELASGQTIAYDRLALATGARVRRLPVPGEDLDGVHYLRTVRHVDAIRERLESARRVVIVGGGFIGLEAASVLVGMGKQVTVLEMQDRLMPRAASRVVSEFYAERHRQAGVVLELAARVLSFSGDKAVREVVCDDIRIPADLVLIGVGVAPNEALAADAGLACNDGIEVDEFAMTADPDVAAAGDCTRHPNPLLGGRIRLESVHNALEQGRTAAASLAGNPKAYQQAPWFWSDQYDLKLQMVGLSASHEDHQLIGHPNEQRFGVCYFSSARLMAVDTINLPAQHMAARKLLNASLDRDITLNRDVLAGFGFDLAAAASTLIS